MDCRITFLNRGLYCDTHHSEGMSALCDVAERELRETARLLREEVEVLQAKLAGQELFPTPTENAVVGRG